MNGYSAYSDFPSRDSISRVATQNNVPQSPTSSAGVEDEEFIRNTVKQPDPSCHVFDGRIYGLKVVQQPNRARMCGFGDKVVAYPQKHRIRLTDRSRIVAPSPLLPSSNS